MNISKISDSNQNFNGWYPWNKQVIVNMIKKMPKAKADKAIELVNNLEATSPHHNLGANVMGFWAVPKDIFTKSKDFDRIIDPLAILWRSPIKCLEKMQEHINKENILIRKAGKFVEMVIPKLKKFGNPHGIFSSGLQLGRKERRFVAKKLAQLSIGENGTQKTDQALQLLDAINEKAQKTNMRVLPPWWNNAIVIHGINLRGGYSRKDIKINDDFLKTLKKVEKFLDKENMKNQAFKVKQKLVDAKEDLAYAKFELRQRRKAVINQSIDNLKKKITDNPVVNFFNKIFENIEQKAQAKETKISKKLKF